MNDRRYMPKKKGVPPKNFQKTRQEGGLKGTKVNKDRGETNRKRFLEAYIEFGTITRAADAAGISHFTHFSWMQKVTGYPEQFKNAQDQFADKVEDELLHRAVTGLVRPKFYKGKQIRVKDPTTGKMVNYMEREPSDNLLMFWLKGRRPEIFREMRELNLKASDIDQAITTALDQLASSR